MTDNTEASRHFVRGVTALGFLVIFLLATAGDSAQAHAVRFIASNGSDANTCTRTAPCLTLQRGIDRTAAGSELIILDSGDFGSGAVIDTSITISAIGVSATIGGGITINAANATVVLRGLRLNGAGAAVIGIRIDNAAAVHVVDCEIQNFGSTGISANTSADTALFVSNTVVRNNSFYGIFFAVGAGGSLTVDNSRFERNGINSSYDGLSINSGQARISRTIFSGNSGEGIHQFGGETNIVWTTAAHNGGSGYRVQGGGRMTVEQSVARGNAFGLRVQQSGTVAVLASSVVTNNGTGLSVAGGTTLLTRANSTVSGNTADVSGTLTILAGQ
jgi:hypothetical protein